MTVLKKRILILLFCVFLGLVVHADRKKILVIHSYHQGLVWTDNITQGIQSVFKDRHDIELHFEYLDTKRNPQEEYRKKLAELYEEKVHTIPYEVIITVDNNALDFVKKYQEQYFKDIPVVFCGINHFKEADRAGIQNVSGVTEDVDYKSTLDLILKCHPKLGRLIVISDDKTASSIRNREEIKRLQQLHFPQLSMVFLEDFTTEQLADTVSSLSSNDVIMLLYFNKDKNGKYISFKESIEFISKTSSVPIYSSWKFHLGEGIVGGMLTSGFDQGRLAAGIATRVLKGDDINKLPLISSGYNQFAFDHKQLKQFNIDPVLLPIKAEIINQPPDFLEKYKFYIWITSGFIIILIITVLSITLKRKQNERRLLAINAELDRRVEERTDELRSANKELTQQKQQITDQNLELERHRHNLQELVNEKTHDLKEANEKLEKSHERLMMMLETNSDGVWEHNLKTREVYFSEEFWDKLGYAYENIEHTKKFVELHTHPDDNPVIEQNRKDYLEGKTDKFKVEFRLKTQDGQWKWFHAKGRALKWDDQGKPEVLIGTHTDITPRKTAQQELLRKNKDIAARNLEYENLNQKLTRINAELAASENRWRSLINQVPDEIILHDLDGNMLEVNPTTSQMLGYSEEELLKLNVGELLPDFFNATENKKYWKDLTAGNPSVTFYSFQRRKDQSTFPVDISLSLIELSNQKYYLAVIHDISKLQETERKILNAVIETEENERKRFAKDLHDTIGPLLSSINLSIAALVKADDKKKLEIIDVSKEAIHEAFHSIKEISNNLSPHILNDFGLGKAIKNFTGKLSVSESVTINFESNILDKRLESNVEVVLYRVVTELINNTIRHAKADTIDISIQEKGRFIDLVYADNGLGFDPESLKTPGQTGMGFSNILSRLKSINGTHEINSEPGKGMQARIVVEL